ncbi:TBC1D30 [Bugula neritina]|uniref:TBC1D30 n=1 Tax=Bugula neritina TaxID=10212 RepID=A0A7J7JWE0_BUGNE|nr:TBC1D30 [Bugula neritina]
MKIKKWIKYLNNFLSDKLFWLFRTLNIFYVLQIWLSLATRYIKDLRIDWNKVLQFAFNDKCNPDDDALGAQIVKDLHRTGCSTFSGIENEEDRVILQRVLLGYARWNKVTGYCQGFNVLAAFILNVTNKNEADALKIMVYLVDHMLPKEYFAHNLRALTVDMAVFRTYLAMKLPKLSAHLTKLQQESVMIAMVGMLTSPY